MGKSTVRVIARTRPTDSLAKSSTQILDDGRSVNVHQERQQMELINNTVADHTFTLDLVLKDASQEHLFDMGAADVVRSVMSGYNGTVMCYGQTGAGKTYTMVGGSDYGSRGVCPRAIKAIFDDVSTNADRTYTINVSFVEVYKERIYDLLDPTSTEDFAIMDDAKGNTTIRGVHMRQCAHEQTALAALFEGNMNRTVGDHALNANSSRSHCIYTIYVSSRSRVESDSASIVSKLHLIDLAGSERLSKTDTSGATAKEAQYINKSLTFLEQVVMALGNTNRSHVPFRQSKLTSLLKDSLGGNSKTTMIANIWPEDRHVEETLSTLRFAARMMKVQTDAAVNITVDPATQIKQLQRTITELKAELQMQNQLMGKSHISYEGTVTEDERFEMEKLVRGFCAGSVPEIPVRSLREVREYFRVFKALNEQKEAESQAAAAHAIAAVALAPNANGKTSAPSSQQTQRDKKGNPITSTANAQQQQLPPSSPVVANAGGAIDKAGGISTGVAAPCKSLKDITKSPTKPGTAAGEAISPHRGAHGTRSPTTAPLEDDLNATNGSLVQSNSGRPAAPDRSAAFDDFKRGAGAKQIESIHALQSSLVDKKRSAVDAGRCVNDYKARIEAYSAQLESRRLERVARGDDELVDDEEFELVKLVKECKELYRDNYDALMNLRAERDQLMKSIEISKQELLKDFESWYNLSFSAVPSSSQQPRGAARNAVNNSRITTATQQSPVNRRELKQEMGLDPDEHLDEGEWFDLLEFKRVRERDPEAVAYYQAKKVVQGKGMSPNQQRTRR